MKLVEGNRNASAGLGRKNLVNNRKLHERLKVAGRMVISDIDGTLVHYAKDFEQHGVRLISYDEKAGTAFRTSPRLPIVTKLNNGSCVHFGTHGGTRRRTAQDGCSLWRGHGRSQIHHANPVAAAAGLRHSRVRDGIKGLGGRGTRCGLFGSLGVHLRSHGS